MQNHLQNHLTGQICPVLTVGWLMLSGFVVEGRKSDFCDSSRVKIGLFKILQTGYGNTRKVQSNHIAFLCNKIDPLDSRLLGTIQFPWLDTSKKLKRVFISHSSLHMVLKKDFPSNGVQEPRCCTGSVRNRASASSTTSR